MRKLYQGTLHSVSSLAAVVAVVFFAGASFAGIVSSEHDFSNKGWNNTGEICVVCHAPHNSNTSVSDAPLWNHAVTTATFTTYSSATLDATTGQPDGISKLCLSCHDGTVAIDNFGGQGGGSQFMSGGELIGTDISNDHPISLVYDSSLASLDGGLHDPSTRASGLGGTVDEDLLFNAKLECGSCHDVHDSQGTGGHLLRLSNNGSALCLTCHDK
ncbi:MAG: cytochrome c3 family protein [Candidatus Binatia bacterium]